MAAEPIAMQARAMVDAPLRALREHDLGNLLQARPRAVRYIVDRLAPGGVVVLGSGNGGSGKSIIFGNILGAHIAAGSPVFGLDVIQGRVLFVSLEDPAEVVRERLHHVVVAYGLDPERVAANYTIVGLAPGGDPVLAEQINELGDRKLRRTALLDELAETAAGCVAIIVDNASDAFSGNENDRVQVRTFMRWLAEIATRNGAALILVAHIDKNAAKYGGAGNSYSGSTAWHNSARSRLVVTETGKGVELKQEKLNLGEKLKDPIRLFWSKPHHTFMPVGVADFEISEADDQAGVLAALRAAEAACTDVGTGRRGTGNAHSILCTFSALPARLGKDAGVFWRALDALRDQGRVEIANVRTPQRKFKDVYREVRARALPPTPPAETGALAHAASTMRGLITDAQLAQTGATGANAYRDVTDGA